jgi:alpha,alpha-trehalase
MNECNSLADPKVTATPVVYLPYAAPTPPALAALQQQCHVDIRHLPRKISRIGDVRNDGLPVKGLLYLPKIATGYKTNEIGFGWTNGVYLELNSLVQHSAK